MKGMAFKGHGNRGEGLENQGAKPRLYYILKGLPFLGTLSLMLIYWFFLRDISLQRIVDFTPENYWLAALVLWGLFALKSLSVVFPKLIIYMSVGIIFPLWAAFGISFLGMLICLSLPYFVGRFSGREIIERLAAKNSRVKEMGERGLTNGIFTSYLLRVIVLLPGDMASMLLGAWKIPYAKYVVGSALGMLPGMIIQTLLGFYLDDPASPSFIGLFLALIAISLLSSWGINKKSKQAAP